MNFSRKNTIENFMPVFPALNIGKSGNNSPQLGEFSPRRRKKNAEAFCRPLLALFVLTNKLYKRNDLFYLLFRDLIFFKCRHIAKAIPDLKMN
jgi:hypothetical protein